VQRFYDFIADYKGKPLAGATVQIQNYPALTSATYYLTTDTSSSLTAPIETGADGSVGFYAADGRYQLTITATNGRITIIPDILLEDPTEGTVALADIAKTSTWAIGAGTASYAGSASNAGFAGTSVYSTSALAASTSTWAIGAGTSSYAGTAGNAANAASAAVAGTSAYSTRALTASTATVAPNYLSLSTASSSAGSNLIGFLQAGTGAVARTLQSKGRERFSVKDFGATGNGVTDDTDEVQACIAAARSATLYGGTEVYFPAGTYILSNELAISLGGVYNNIVVSGAGQQTTTLDFATAGVNTHGISFATGLYFSVRDMTILNATLDGVYVGKGNTGTNYSSSYDLTNLHIKGCGRHGVHLTNTYMGVLQHIFCESNTGDGFCMDGFHTSLHVVQCEGAASGGNGWTLNSIVYSNFISCGSDNNAYAGYALSNMRGVTFSSCGTESNQRDGYLLISSDASASGVPAPAQDIKGVVFSGCYNYNNSLASAGTYGTFIRVTTSNSRNIEFEVIGGSSTPAGTSDKCFILNGTSGTVLFGGEGHNQADFTAASTTSGTVQDRYAYSGSFTATGVGFAGTLTATWQYRINNGVCTISLPATFSGTSTTSSFSVTGFPNVCAPSASRFITGIWGQDSGATLGTMYISLAGTGTAQLGTLAAGLTGWQGTGVKGILSTQFDYVL
jgi:hypothetical protein